MYKPSGGARAIGSRHDKNSPCHQHATSHTVTARESQPDLQSHDLFPYQDVLTCKSTELSGLKIAAMRNQHSYVMILYKRQEQQNVRFRNFQKLA